MGINLERLYLFQPSQNKLYRFSYKKFLYNVSLASDASPSCLIIHVHEAIFEFAPPPPQVRPSKQFPTPGYKGLDLSWGLPKGGRGDDRWNRTTYNTLSYID